MILLQRKCSTTNKVFGGAIDESLPADQRRVMHFAPSGEPATLRIGRQHQLAFWKTVTLGEAVNYISREHFEVIANPNANGGIDLRVKNLSSNGIHRDATGHSAFVEMKKHDELPLDPEGCIILNCHTKHEVKVRVRVAQQPNRIRRQSSESRRLSGDNRSPIPVTPGNQMGRGRRPSSLTPRHSG